MSLLSNQRNWMTFGGEPVQGLTPTSVRLRAGTLTPERRAGAQAAYNKFCTAKSLSLAGGGYFTGDELLPDGTRVRMVSINGVDHVHIWAADPAPEEALDITFWCQPFDEDWLTEQYEEVFTIPRWFDINDTDASSENDSSHFLDDLLRNESYEPAETANYPGNQTWFKPGTGLVVSWWGQMRRYSNSLLDQTIDQAKSWLRPTDPRNVFLTAPSLGGRVGPTGGIAGALAGQLFHQEGVGSLPVGLPSTLPVFPTMRVTRRIWVNGSGVDLPAGMPVGSACSGMRSGKPVLRATSVIASNLIVLEMDPETGAWATLATMTLNAGSLGIPHPRTINDAPFGPGWTIFLDGIEQPFYWNASGNKAVGLLRFARETTTLSLAAIVHATVELTVGASSCTLDLIDHASETSVTSISSTDSDSPLIFTHSLTLDSVRSYSSVIAADYRGDALTLLRSHIDETLTRTENYTDARTSTPVYDGSGDVIGVESTYERDGTITQNSTVHTWASINGIAISSTSETRTSSLTHTTSDLEFDGVSTPGSDPDYSIGDAHTTFAASGAASLWGISAGDLRGEFVLHAQPIYGVSDTFEADKDSSYSYDMSYSYPVGGGGGSTASASFSKSLRTDIGRMLLVRDGSVVELAKLIHPNWLGRVGSGTQSWVNGSLTTATSSGPYGAGPTWTDFAIPSTSHSFGNASTTTTAASNWTRNFMNWSFPYGAPSSASSSSSTPITAFVGGGASGPGGFANTALTGCAITPDLRVQYTGALFVGMCPPTAPTTAVSFEIDRWSVDGTEFSPPYPDQPDPEIPGGTVPFPHRGGHSILLNPIFTGPLP